MPTDCIWVPRSRTRERASREATRPRNAWAGHPSVRRQLRFARRHCWASQQCPLFAPPRAIFSLKCIGHDLLRFADDLLEMVLAQEALGVNLVDVFCAGRAGSEPAVCRNDFEAAN